MVWIAIRNCKNVIKSFIEKNVGKGTKTVAFIIGKFKNLTISITNAFIKLTEKACETGHS